MLKLYLAKIKQSCSNHCIAPLREDPKVIVETIRSVKGGEAILCQLSVVFDKK